MTTFEVFRRAERIEAVTAAIYAHLARQFAGDDAARALFVRLEAEEVQHAARIRLLRGHYRDDSKLLGSFSGEAELEAGVARAEAALAEVEAGSWGLDLAEVKARLAALEAQLAAGHAQTIAEDGHPALRVFFRQLAQQDDAHAALLQAT